MKLFVYGTLKKGYYNHGWLKNTTKYLYDEVIHNFTLYDTGYGYPAAVSQEGSYIEGEVYEIDKETYRNIKSMEVGAGYEEKIIGDLYFFIYTQNKLDMLYNKNLVGTKW